MIVVGDKLLDIRLKEEEPLSVQDKFFVKQVVSGVNTTEAAKKSYGVERHKTAVALGKSAINHPTIKQVIDEISERIGYGLEDAIRKVAEHARSDDAKISLDGLRLYFDVTGNKAPAKSEVDVNTKFMIEQSKADEIQRVVREEIEKSKAVDATVVGGGS